MRDYFRLTTSNGFHSRRTLIASPAIPFPILIGRTIAHARARATCIIYALGEQIPCIYSDVTGRINTPGTFYEQFAALTCAVT